MKKTILAMLMALMISTPCLAQEIEPEGIFSIDGMLWDMYLISFGVVLPMLPFIRSEEYTMGFHQGTVYMCDQEFGCLAQPPYYSYINLPGVSIVYHLWSSLPIVPPSWTVGLAILQPSGFGIYMEFNCILEYIFIGFMSKIGIMYKVEDGWVPPETILGIDPSQGEQGATLTNVHLFAHNTTFQDNPPVYISFDPPDGLTVSNINVITNDVIEFDLEIAVDAPTGLRQVTVTYDDGKKSVESSEIYTFFKVTEKN